jgi:hypothetical protein
MNEINENDIWAEIDAIYKVSERKVGDIDAHQISKRYGIGVNAARARMERMVASGEYHYEIVRDNTSSNGKRKIIRKVK